MAPPGRELPPLPPALLASHLIVEVGKGVLLRKVADLEEVGAHKAAVLIQALKVPYSLDAPVILADRLVVFDAYPEAKRQLGHAAHKRNLSTAAPRYLAPVPDFDAGRLLLQVVFVFHLCAGVSTIDARRLRERLEVLLRGASQRGRVRLSHLDGGERATRA